MGSKQSSHACCTHASTTLSIHNMKGRFDGTCSDEESGVWSSSRAHARPLTHRSRRVVGRRSVDDCSASRESVRARGLGFGVWGLGFGVWGLGFGVWGLEFRDAQPARRFEARVTAISATCGRCSSHTQCLTTLAVTTAVWASAFTMPPPIFSTRGYSSPYLQHRHTRRCHTHEAAAALAAGEAAGHVTYTLGLPSPTALARTAQAIAPNSCRHKRFTAASVSVEKRGVMQCSTCR